MRILVIHNKYKEKGGEDNSFALECEMLKNHGNEVKQLVFHNDQIDSWKGVIRLSYGLFYNRKSARLLEEEIEKFQPEIVHVHNFFYIASPSIFFVTRKYRIPVLFTVRNYRLICSGALLMRDGKICELCIGKSFPMSGIKYACHRDSRLQTAHLTMMTGLHKKLGTWNRKIDKFIVLTDFAKEKLLNSSLKLLPDQIEVKPNFAFDHGYAPLESREPYYLFIGRLSKEKGVDILLKAFLKNQLPLKIIGVGPLKELTKDFLHQAPNVDYLGFQEAETIIKYLKKCRAMVFPSVWYEGLPRTILEAFSTGTPVISSDIDNINTIVNQEKNGLHFSTGNADSLCEVIEQFEQNAQKYKNLYTGARNTFEERYSYESNYRQLFSIYQQLIKNKQIDEN